MKEFKRCKECGRLIKNTALRELLPYCAMCKAKGVHYKKINKLIGGMEE